MLHCVKIDKFKKMTLCIIMMCTIYPMVQIYVCLIYQFNCIIKRTDNIIVSSQPYKLNQSTVGTNVAYHVYKKNYFITNKGIAEDISFNLGFFLYMYKDSRILNLNSEDAWSKILKLEFATLVQQTNRCSNVDEKGGLDNTFPYYS